MLYSIRDMPGPGSQWSVVDPTLALNRYRLDGSQLVRRDDAREVVCLSNGCACHTLRSAFEGELGSYLSRTDGADRIDYVVIETSGVAEPMPLVDAVTRRFGKLARARLDSVVAVFDADSVAHRLGLLGDGSSGSLDALETVQMRGADLILLPCGRSDTLDLADIAGNTVQLTTSVTVLNMYLCVFICESIQMRQSSLTS